MELGLAGIALAKARHEPVELGGVSYDLDVGSATSVARIAIDRPGDYEIEVRGSADPDVDGIRLEAGMARTRTRQAEHHEQQDRPEKAAASHHSSSSRRSSFSQRESCSGSSRS